MSRALVLAVLALACIAVFAEAGDASLRRRNWGRRVLMKRGACNSTAQWKCNLIEKAAAPANWAVWGCDSCTIGAAAPHTECGAPEHCPGGACYKCNSGGWNCGLSALIACNDPNAQTVEWTWPTSDKPHTLCGSATQCPGAHCYMCNSGGWNCGQAAATACGSSAKYVGEVDYDYTKPHSQCGSNDHCPGGKCFMCGSGGWNCGNVGDNVLACGSYAPAIGDSEIIPPEGKHSLCGAAAHCPGQKCYRCGANGWNCGDSSIKACGADGYAFL